MRKLLVVVVMFLLTAPLFFNSVSAEENDVHLDIKGGWGVTVSVTNHMDHNVTANFSILYSFNRTYDGRISNVTPNWTASMQVTSPFILSRVQARMECEEYYVQRLGILVLGFVLFLTEERFP